jgi:hypothetical protein
MSRKVNPTRRTSVPAVIIAIAVVAVVAVIVTRSPAQPVQQGTAPHLVDVNQQDHHAAGGGRTVVVARLGETVPGISGETGPLMTTLVSGQYPEGATEATVTTGENCAADQDGVSHCLNELDFGTTKVVVQHHHAMARTPCLTPGEVVQVETIAQYQTAS